MHVDTIHQKTDERKFQNFTELRKNLTLTSKRNKLFNDDPPITPLGQQLKANFKIIRPQPLILHKDSIPISPIRTSTPKSISSYPSSIITALAGQKTTKSNKRLNRLLADELNTAYNFITDQSPESRQKTPSFCRRKSFKVQELKDICEKLIEEQEKMKEQLINQHAIIENLQTNFLPIKMKSYFNAANDKKRSSSNMKTSSVCKKELASLKSIEGLNFKFSENNSRNSLNCSPKNAEQISFPFIIGGIPEKALGKSQSPAKYSKDQPIISKNLRFPKEIFCHKK